MGYIVVHILSLYNMLLVMLPPELNYYLPAQLHYNNHPSLNYALVLSHSIIDVMASFMLIRKSTERAEFRLLKVTMNTFTSKTTWMSLMYYVGTLQKVEEIVQEDRF